MVVRVVSVLLSVVYCIGSVSAQNVALNKPVTIVSGASSLLPSSPSLSVITDGTFLNEATAYSAASAVAGSIRWNTNAPSGTIFEIVLGGLHTIDGIIVQADDNDALSVSYRDMNDVFQPLASVPFVSVGFGFRTRPNADQVTWAVFAPVNTTTIRVTNTGGDGFYGISELQLRGTPVPEPSSIAFCTLAVMGMTIRRRLRR